MKFIYRLLGRLPLPLLYCMSTLAAIVVYRFVRYRRRVVADNLLHAFPELSADQRRQIERGVYRHLCDVGFEIIAARRLPRAEFQRRVTLENPEVLLPYKNSKQGILFLTCHQCNWEWLLHVVSDYMGCPIDAVYKKLHNPHFDAFVFDARARSGNPIAFKDAGREMLRRRREFRGFAMLADQAPFKRDKRYWHNFFGRPGSFYVGPQVIAEATQYPVIFAAMTKLRRGHYSTRFEVLAEPPHSKGGFAILDRYIVALETTIRAQPETWMWSNRKWKHRPPVDWQQNPVA
jgi:Kdo2-lipid IVA lauroyltransferase/acyltransferase